VLVVTSGVDVNAQLLDRVGPRYVITTTSGYEHIELEAARERGIAVSRCPLARRDAVVEHALVGMLYLSRRFARLDAAARGGEWVRGELPQLAPVLVRGATVAVIGLGVIGSRMANVLSGLGARVLGVDPAAYPSGVEKVSLEQALSHADFVTLHCNLTPSSAGLFRRDRLEGLAPGTIVVNTARGDVLDADAAVALTLGGLLGGVAIDVFPSEPWPMQGASDRVLLTTHSSGYTTALSTAVATEVLDALDAFTQGRALPARIA
jgi:phosphoglycerate dehydrogenase-like enzyme